MSEEKPSKGPAFLVPGHIPEEMTEEQRKEAVETGASFAQAVGHDSEPCLVITGEFLPEGYPVRPADKQVRDCLIRAFGYQDKPETKRVINVLLDSPGGVLDSAFKIVRYLTWYAKHLRIYVPRRAKSASTLLALGAERIYLSPFGELGPLDAQILSPRNPQGFVSALDCYQSVDYVRKFGVDTMSQSLSRLGDDARSQIAFVDLLEAASSFGTGAIRPMLEGIKALDFGAWGRSLQIGEIYARQVLSNNKQILTNSRPPDSGDGSSPGRQEPDPAAAIASRLVYDYPHHLYFMDYREIKDIGLETEIMSKDIYDAAMRVLEKCEGKSFVDFVSSAESEMPREKRQQGAGNGTGHAPALDAGAPGRRRPEEHPAGHAGGTSGQTGKPPVATA